MFKIDYNPCFKRDQEFISKLTLEQQQRIKKMREGIPPKLIKIKRNRKPVEVNVGDVFIVGNREGLYFYGKVIKKLHTTKMHRDWYNDMFVVFIFNCITTEKTLQNFSPDYNNLISSKGPMILVNDFWRIGYFEILGNVPLSRSEKKLDYGFFEAVDKGEGGIFLNSNFDVMNHFPKYFNVMCAMTIYGVEYAIEGACIAMTM